MNKVFNFYACKCYNSYSCNKRKRISCQPKCNYCPHNAQRNNYYPEIPKDKKGHGIGLNNVSARLQLLYPDAYELNAVAEEKQIQGIAQAYI